jgi:hypothetical protein
VINEAEAATVRHIFQRFVELGSATLLTRELVAQGVVSKRGRLIDKGFLYKLFRNRVYIGEAVHKGTSYPGEHQAIIDKELWEQVQSILQESPRSRAAKSRCDTPALLKGLMFTDTGVAMTPTATRKGSRSYRYYTSMDAIRNRSLEGTDGFVRLNAGMVEGAVLQELRKLLRTSEVTSRAIAAIRQSEADIDDNDVVAALADFDAVWETLFPAEQARIARLLVNRVTVSQQGLTVDLRAGGLGSLVRDMLAPRCREKAA